MHAFVSPNLLDQSRVIFKHVSVKYATPYILCLCTKSPTSLQDFWLFRNRLNSLNYFSNMGRLKSFRDFLRLSGTLYMNCHIQQLSSSHTYYLFATNVVCIKFLSPRFFLYEYIGYKTKAFLLMSGLMF
jgi:hypothetical protein